jgi:hypothetical protein
MKAPSTRHRLWLGLGLILLSNVVALAGVYYNRSGVPHSSLTLTQRELHLPYGNWLRHEENSNRSLELVWRHGGDDGKLDWLSEEKLQTMGFQLPDRDADDGSPRFRRQRSRSVLLVLELDGPAYRRQLQAARQALVEAETRLELRPDDEELRRQRKQQHEQLEQEERYASRLFLVDAGLDAAALRQAYPDRQRYALLAGRLKPYYQWGSPGQRLGANVSLENPRVSVPYALRELFADWQPGGGYHEDGRRVRAQVAFGRRHEPWMVDASR